MPADSDDDPAVPIVCPECETETAVPLAEVADAVDRHNDRLHGGDEVAAVDPVVRERLADLVAEDMDLL
ncbi:MAG: hypothetical protein ABEJ79_06160 [Halolamina sp.]